MGRGGTPGTAATELSELVERLVDGNRPKPVDVVGAVLALKEWLGDADRVADHLRRRGKVVVFDFEDPERSFVSVDYPLELPDEAWESSELRDSVDSVLEEHGLQLRMLVPERMHVSSGVTGAMGAARRDVVEAAKIRMGWHEAVDAAPALADKVREYLSDTRRVIEDVKRTGLVRSTHVQLDLHGTEASTATQELAVRALEGEKDALPGTRWYLWASGHELDDKPRRPISLMLCPPRRE